MAATPPDGGREDAEETSANAFSALHTQERRQGTTQVARSGQLNWQLKKQPRQLPQRPMPPRPLRRSVSLETKLKNKNYFRQSKHTSKLRSNQKKQPRQLPQRPMPPKPLRRSVSLAATGSACFLPSCTSQVRHCSF